ncbi:MAG: DNA polymerase/3'-5' exonuclease PolX [Nitrospirae bacterium]|nr:DNA polymerase/3'-5' exonuclease PolX [Nitrospirota bacterium]
MKNQEIAKIFNEIADILEIKGDNPFRIRAYRKAAQNIDSFTMDVSEASEEELMGIPGIGHDLAGKVIEYVKTGHIKTYEELSKEVSPGFIELLSVPGLGPKTARLLHDKLKIKNLDELERLAKAGKLKGLPGIQAKTEQNILKGIDMRKRYSERQPIARVLPLAEEIIKRLREKTPLKKLSLAGSLRRWKETIKDIDILATSTDPAKGMSGFIHLPEVRDILSHGPTKSSIVTHEGIQVDLRVVDDSSFGSALAYFTGSKEHNIRLREMAVKKGLKINEYGIFKAATGEKIGGEDEADVYKALGIPFIPPEMREDNGEIDLAITGKLPSLIELRDIRGDLHVHSRWSDGSHDFSELINEAKKRGYEYIAVTDHSKGLGIARGMSVERILEQVKEIRAINKKLTGFKLLAGTEVDIRSNGALDYPDEILRELDIVLASIHSGFRQSSEQLTGRLISAMKNPYVSVIAHPTGRLIGERDAYEVDMDEFLRAANETETAIEINAYPLRLDLNDVSARKAMEMGISLVISTDAHILPQFDYMAFGIGIARRGWLKKSDVLNTYGAEALLKRLKRKQAKA